MSVGQVDLDAGCLAPGGLDLDRMRAERTARLRAQMEQQGVDVLVLLHGPHVTYATGAPLLAADSSHANFVRPVAVVVAGQDVVHLFTPDPDPVPGTVAHPQAWVMLDEGVERFAAQLREVAGDLDGRVVGVDELTGAMTRARDHLFGGARLVDASMVIGAAKITKTPDELECIRRAQHLNNLAMLDVYPLVKPGVRRCDLTAAFLARIHELGIDANMIDPIFQAMPASVTAGPWTVHGDVAFPTGYDDRRPLEAGEVIWNDSGCTYQGYASDFGRTWVVGGRPEPELVSLYHRWRDVVDAVVPAIRPGATNADLTRAAVEANGGEKPWLPHFYLAHGVGIESAEMPLVGTDLGEEFDAGFALQPGMVLVLEPVCWRDGVGGYRAEEIYAVTEDGSVCLSGQHPYDPFPER